MASNLRQLHAYSPTHAALCFLYNKQMHHAAPFNKVSRTGAPPCHHSRFIMVAGSLRLPGLLSCRRLLQQWTSLPALPLIEPFVWSDLAVVRSLLRPLICSKQCLPAALANQAVDETVSALLRCAKGKGELENVSSLPMDPSYGVISLPPLAVSFLVLQLHQRVLTVEAPGTLATVTLRKAALYCHLPWTSYLEALAAVPFIRVALFTETMSTILPATTPELAVEGSAAAANPLAKADTKAQEAFVVQLSGLKVHLLLCQKVVPPGLAALLFKRGICVIQRLGLRHLGKAADLQPFPLIHWTVAA